MRKLIDLLASPRGLWLILGIALLLSAPALRVGFLNDDYLHRASLNDKFTDYERSALEQYDFFDEHRDPISSLRERGFHPWWAAEDLHVRFFRPLTSLSLAVDHWAFGFSPLPAHIHSLLYYLLCIALAFAILRLLLPARMAGVGTLLYAIAGAHSTPLAWVAARHVLLGGALGLAAIAAHLYFRERTWRPGRWLALVALIAGAFASETVLGAVAIIGCYELFGARDPWRQRVRALAPVVALALGYLVFYAAADYGARGSYVYTDPFADPVGFVIACLTRIPCLLGDALTGVPAEAHFFMGASIVPQAVFGILITLAIVGLLLLTRKQLDGDVVRHLCWIGIGSIAALVPMAGGMVGGRMLTIALIGSAAILGALVVALRERARALFTAQRRARARLVLAGLIGLLVVHTGLSMLVRVGIASVYAQVTEEQWRIARDSHIDCGPAGDVVMLATPDPSFSSTFTLATMALRSPEGMPYRSYWVLSMARNDQRLERVTTHGFDMVVVGPRAPSLWESLHRDSPLRVGQVVTVRDMRIEIMAVHAGVPTHLRVSFERPLDAPDLCFVHWHDGLLRTLELPAPGGRLDLVREPSPLAP